jgi:hypothetical protein
MVLVSTLQCSFPNRLTANPFIYNGDGSVKHELCRTLMTEAFLVLCRSKVRLIAPYRVPTVVLDLHLLDEFSSPTPTLIRSSRPRIGGEWMDRRRAGPSNYSATS